MIKEYILDVENELVTLLKDGKLSKTSLRRYKKTLKSWFKEDVKHFITKMPSYRGMEVPDTRCFKEVYEAFFKTKPFISSCDTWLATLYWNDLVRRRSYYAFLKKLRVDKLVHVGYYKGHRIYFDFVYFRFKLDLGLDREGVKKLLPEVKFVGEKSIKLDKSIYDELAKASGLTS